ncbi:hypothetical protein [Capnocytophaga sp. G2]|uniref:hypothetical protein n=1 Tax=Capnocytophaga sp. G2 TaxID=3110695 RepID=UPI002B45E441|nr:hypothetical protein [Capnocytophaga sp. G2]MEB3005179.1 hypothetical protein [Capnocytophaga sp. G2]
MQKQRTGIIHFLTKEESGRQHPPTGEVYYATTHIAQLDQPNWSIVIIFDKPIKEDEYSALCQVKFLFDHAPHPILDELKEMEVYEGAKIVGRIVFE